LANAASVADGLGEAFATERGVLRVLQKEIAADALCGGEEPARVEAGVA